MPNGEHSRAFLPDKQRVRASFNQAADSYDGVAVLQQEIGRRLLERLDLVRLTPAVVCDLGCGTGQLTEALTRRYRRARVLGLDLADAMLSLARGRARPWRRLPYVCGDMEAVPLADNSCDLLFSNLSLQWCPALGQALSEMRRVLKPGGLLLFSTLGPDTLHELRDSWARVDRHNHVNGFVDMHDIGDALLACGFAEPVMDSERVTMTYGELMQLMRELKALGAHNVTAGRPVGLTGPGRLRQLCRAYESFRREGVLPATYEVVYGHAWGPMVEPVQPGAIRVPAVGSRSGVR
jgi:malonyl-CoA O-methyltransferase